MQEREKRRRTVPTSPRPPVPLPPEGRRGNEGGEGGASLSAPGGGEGRGEVGGVYSLALHGAMLARTRRPLHRTMVRCDHPGAGLLTHRDRDPMERVVEVALRVPGDGVGLADALRIRRPGPDLVVSGSRKLDRGAPVLPSVSVHRLIERSVYPGRAEVDREMDGADRPLAGPGVPPRLQHSCSPSWCRWRGG